MGAALPLLVCALVLDVGLAARALLGALAVWTAGLAAVAGALRRGDGEQRAYERARLEARVAALVDESERRATQLRKQNETLGDVTHELKTPLVTIRGYADMLRVGRLGVLTERQRHAVEVVRNSALRLQLQIDRILVTARGANAREAIGHRVSLELLLDEVRERHGPAAQDKGIDLTIERPAKPAYLWGDRMRLGEVFDNLVANAVKFTEPGGRVMVRFAPPTGGPPAGWRLPVEVSDTGCGIPSGAIERIFERGEQADPTVRERYGGTGLGLAIVRRNLGAHGGEIRAESEVGVGSRFLFDLPLAPGEGND